MRDILHMRLICSLDAEDIFFNKSLAEKVSGVIISNRLEGTLTGGPFISGPAII